MKRTLFRLFLLSLLFGCITLPWDDQTYKNPSNSIPQNNLINESNLSSNVSVNISVNTQMFDISFESEFKNKQGISIYFFPDFELCKESSLNQTNTSVCSSNLASNYFKDNERFIFELNDYNWTFDKIRSFNISLAREKATYTIYPGQGFWNSNLVNIENSSLYPIGIIDDQFSQGVAFCYDSSCSSSKNSKTRELIFMNQTANILGEYMRLWFADPKSDISALSIFYEIVDLDPYSSGAFWKWSLGDKNPKLRSIFMPKSSPAYNRIEKEGKNVLVKINSCESSVLTKNGAKIIFKCPMDEFEDGRNFDIFKTGWKFIELENFSKNNTNNTWILVNDPSNRDSKKINLADKSLNVSIKWSEYSNQIVMIDIPSSSAAYSLIYSNS